MSKLKWEELDDRYVEIKSIFIPGRFKVILDPEANMCPTSVIEMVYFIEFSCYSKFKATEHTNNPNKMIDLVVYFIVQWKQNNNWDEISLVWLFPFIYRHYRLPIRARPPEDG